MVGEVGEGEGLSKKERGLMDIDNSFIIAGGNVRMINGNGKNTMKNCKKKIKKHLLLPKSKLKKHGSLSHSVTRSHLMHSRVLSLHSTHADPKHRLPVQAWIQQ